VQFRDEEWQLGAPLLVRGSSVPCPAPVAGGQDRRRQHDGRSAVSDTTHEVEHEERACVLEFTLGGVRHRCLAADAAKLFEHLAFTVNRSEADGQREARAFEHEGNLAQHLIHSGLEFLANATEERNKALENWQLADEYQKKAGSLADEAHGIVQKAIDVHDKSEAQAHAEQAEAVFRNAAANLTAAWNHNKAGWESWRLFTERFAGAAAASAHAAKCVEEDCHVMEEVLVTIIFGPEAGPLVSMLVSAGDDIAGQFGAALSGEPVDWKKLGIDLLVDAALAAFTEGAGALGKAAEEPLVDGMRSTLLKFVTAAEISAVAEESFGTAEPWVAKAVVYLGEHASEMIEPAAKIIVKSLEASFKAAATDAAEAVHESPSYKEFGEIFAEKWWPSARVELVKTMIEMAKDK
jgi:hypothetical protein